MVFGAIRGAARSARDFAGDLWAGLRSHPGLLLAAALLCGLLAWSINDKLSRTCADLAGIFRDLSFGPILTFDQSVSLLEHYPSLRDAVNRCHIDVGNLTS